MSRHHHPPNAKTCAAGASPAHRLSRRQMLRWLAGAAGLASGCNYMVGAPFAEDVHTVAVPIFQASTFRRQVEFMLTEAVQKEIEWQTPFRVTDRDQADTLLTGRIVDIRKPVMGETAFDEARQLNLTYFIEVSWEDLRTSRLLAEQQVQIPPQVVPLLNNASFAPEAGQSLATATDEVVRRLARDIVSRMEMPW